jgi:hypothetical protein
VLRHDVCVQPTDHRAEEPEPEDGESGDNAPIGIFDLVADDGVLGPDHRKARLAGIEFGHAMVGHLAPRDLPQLSRTPGFEDWDYTIIQFPFDLRDVPPGWRYLEATIRAHIDDPSTIVLQLDTTPRHDPLAVLPVDPQLGAGGSGPGVAAPAGSALLDAARASTFGHGTNRVAWKFEAPDDEGLQPGGNCVVALARSRRDLDTVVVELGAEYTFVRKVFGIVDRKEPGLREPVRGRLSLADGSFELLMGS